MTSDNIRDDIKIFQMASELATQGFDFRDISFEEKKLSVIIRDIMDITEKEKMWERMIHSTQFIYTIWLNFNMDTIVINHTNNKDELLYTIVGNGNDCEAIMRGDLDFDKLSSKLTITFHKSKLTLRINDSP